MWRPMLVFFCLVYYSFGSGALQEITIKLFYSYGKPKCEVSDSFKYIKGEKFRFSVVRKNKLKKIDEINISCQICSNKYVDIGTILGSFEKYHVVNKTLTASMDNACLWLCKVFIKTVGWNWNIWPFGIEKQCNIHIDVYVRDPDYGTLKINGSTVRTETVTKQERFDTVGYHYFYEGELVDISCKPINTDVKNNYVIVSLINKDNKAILSKGNLDQAKMNITLTSDYDDAYIDCKIMNNSVTIVYIRVYLKLNVTSDVLNDVNKTNSHVEELNPENGKSDYTAAYAAAGAVIVTAIAVGLMILFWKGKRAKGNLTNEVSYNNLSENTEEPTNRQIEQRTFESNATGPKIEEHIDKNIEELYSKPIPKNQRKAKSEDEKLQSQVVSSVNLTTDQQQPEQLTYIELELHPTTVTSVKFTPKCEYSEVLSTERPKRESIELDDTEYYNEFNSRYVNAKSNDYAEPTYCEINDKDINK